MCTLLEAECAGGVLAEVPCLGGVEGGVFGMAAGCGLLIRISLPPERGVPSKV